MPEEARREHRDGDETRILAAQRDAIGRHRHFGHIELAVADHAEERLFDIQNLEIEIDPVGPNLAGLECFGPVISPAGER